MKSESAPPLPVLPKDLPTLRFAAFRERQIAILEGIATGAKLQKTLEAVISLIQEQAPGTIASVLLLSEDGGHMKHGAALNLPEVYCQAIDGCPIGPCAGSCGTAMFTRQRVIVTDIATDPLWAEFHHLALEHGLRSCWSEPILDAKGQVLGSFAMYHRSIRAPLPEDLQIIRVAAHLAGVAIERDARARAEQAATREREAVERKLVEAQKLESLSILAGGVAHDFNNLLTGILGNASLARMQLTEEQNPIKELLDGIEETAMRAADLCNQMLAYAGRGRFVVQKLDLSELARDSVRLLEVSISKNAELHFDLSLELPLVECDATQIRQVIMNLVINASEALGERAGRIGIKTGVQYTDRAYLAETYLAQDLAEGHYVFLEISDTGMGMNSATLARIFDPFFTTKFTGRGLGLAAVLGIARSHHGTLKVYSELGKGSSFKLLLPPAEGAHQPSPPVPAPTNQWRGEGQVLLVDDEETVRLTGSRMLQSFGFVVTTAANGQEALEIFRANPTRFRVVVLDLTMPVLNGPQTYQAMRKISPGVRALLISGFNERDALNGIEDLGIVGFLQKPFVLSALEEKLREILP